MKKEHSSILIIEDDPRVALIIQRGLESIGIASDVALDGEIGLKYFSSRLYHLIILDIGLPDMSGYQVCREIRLLNKDIPVLFLTMGFGMIGFVDDYIKVVKKRSLGLRAWQKMLGQIVVTGIFAFYLVTFTEVSLAMRLPFLEGKTLGLGILNLPFLFLVVLATVNGTNFTDGLDGLAGSVTVEVAGFFCVASLAT